MTQASMKIAFVLPTMPGGGVEVSMLRIGSYFQKKGHAVSFITTESPGNWFGQIGSAGMSGSHVQGLRQCFPRAHASRVGRLLRDGGYDVVFPVFDRFSQAALGMLPDKTIVIPLLRNDHPEIYEIGLGNHGAWNVAVANSPRNHQQARKLTPLRPIEMIPNGVELPKQTERGGGSEWQPPLRLVFVGRLVHESKGVLLLPEILNGAVQRGLDCTLTIAGDGVDRDALESGFAQYRLQGKVSILGMVEREEVLSLISSSHVLLLPSFYEGLPNVVLEAQANGCVPIATRMPGVTDFLIRDGETGYLVEPHDVTGFVDRITEIYRSPAKARELADNGISFMQREFSAEREGSRYLALIEQAMAGQYPLPQTRHLGPRLDRGLFPKAYIRNKYRTLLKEHLPRWAVHQVKALRGLRRAARLFIDEYVANRVVAYVPSTRFRSYFYRRILKISMDHSVNIQMGCYLYPAPAPFVIGTNSIINRYCTLDRRGGLYIGSCVNVSAEVAIYTAGHDPQLSDFHDYVKPVTIEDYVWLGTRSMIMPGVTIGKGAVVLPGAIVTRNVEPYAIVGGTPARKVGERRTDLDYNPSWWPLFQ